MCTRWAMMDHAARGPTAVPKVVCDHVAVRRLKCCGRTDTSVRPGDGGGGRGISGVDFGQSH
ncbi:hypothetical protein KSP40_PGU011162 [Platanthera guangdongensis]|uniref:Uncharacterized protein n=1 Tax=Platanthera guangdongensis TaxID=2320717 RepID=A0ABR2MBI4_9ASPA